MVWEYDEGTIMNYHLYDNDTSDSRTVFCLAIIKQTNKLKQQKQTKQTSKHKSNPAVPPSWTGGPSAFCTKHIGSKTTT